MLPQMRIQPQTDLMTTNERLDILEDLPRSTIRRYRNAEVIYDSDTPATHLYLVIEGRVKVLHRKRDGKMELIEAP